MKRTAQERADFVSTRAAEMRESPTKAEAHMWELLKPLGFERQYPFTAISKNGGYHAYILDFFNPKLRLCIEVDGGVHSRQKGRDRRRDTRLQAMGITTARIPNREALKQTPETLGVLIDAVRAARAAN